MAKKLFSTRQKSAYSKPISLSKLTGTKTATQNAFAYKPTKPINLTPAPRTETSIAKLEANTSPLDYNPREAKSKTEGYLGKIGDILSYPQQRVAGYITGYNPSKQNISGQDIIKSITGKDINNMSLLPRAGLSTVATLATDPLMYVPGEAFSHGLKFLAEAGGKVVDHFPKIREAMDTLKDTFGKKFIPGYGLTDAEHNARVTLGHTIHHGLTDVESKAKAFAHELKPTFEKTKQILNDSEKIPSIVANKYKQNAKNHLDSHITPLENVASPEKNIYDLNKKDISMNKVSEDHPQFQHSVKQQIKHGSQKANDLMQEKALWLRNQGRHDEADALLDKNSELFNTQNKIRNRDELGNINIENLNHAGKEYNAFALNELKKLTPQEQEDFALFRHELMGSQQDREIPKSAFTPQEMVNNALYAQDEMNPTNHFTVTNAETNAKLGLNPHHGFTHFVNENNMPFLDVAKTINPLTDTLGYREKEFNDLLKETKQAIPESSIENNPAIKVFDKNYEEATDFTTRQETESKIIAEQNKLEKKIAKLKEDTKTKFDAAKQIKNAIQNTKNDNERIAKEISKLTKQLKDKTLTEKEIKKLKDYEKELGKQFNANWKSIITDQKKMDEAGQEGQFLVNQYSKLEEQLEKLNTAKKPQIDYRDLWMDLPDESYHFEGRQGLRHLIYADQERLKAFQNAIHYIISPEFDKALEQLPVELQNKWKEFRTTLQTPSINFEVPERYHYLRKNLTDAEFNQLTPLLSQNHEKLTALNRLTNAAVRKMAKSSGLPYEWINNVGYERHMLNNQNKIFLESQFKEPNEEMNKTIYTGALKPQTTGGLRSSDVNYFLGRNVFNPNYAAAMRDLYTKFPKALAFNQWANLGIKFNKLKSSSQKEWEAWKNLREKVLFHSDYTKQELAEYQRLRKEYGEFEELSNSDLRKMKDFFSQLEPLYKSARTDIPKEERTIVLDQLNSNAAVDSMKEFLKSVQEGNVPLVSKYWTNALEQMNTLFNRDTKQGWQKIFTYLTSWWKKYKLLNPGFNFKNNLGNISQLWISGMPMHTILPNFIKAREFQDTFLTHLLPKMYRNWEKNYKAIIDASFDEQEKLLTEGFSAKEKKDWDQAIEFSKMGFMENPRFTTDFMDLQDHTEELFGKAYEKNPNLNPQKLNNVMQRLINWNYNEMLKADFSAKYAAYEYAKEHPELLERLNLDSPESFARYAAFDYEDLTPFEKNTMQSLIPFYVWSRKALELMLKTLLRDNPKKFIQFNDMYKGANWGITKGYDIPGFEKEDYQIALPIGNNIDYINPGLVPSVWNGMNIKGLLGRINPVIAAPFNLMSAVYHPIAGQGFNFTKLGQTRAKPYWDTSLLTPFSTPIKHIVQLVNDLKDNNIDLSSVLPSIASREGMSKMQSMANAAYLRQLKEELMKEERLGLSHKEQLQIKKALNDLRLYHLRKKNIKYFSKQSGGKYIPTRKIIQ